MKKDPFKVFEQEYDDPEEKAQAEKEEKVFRRLMSCSMLLIGAIAVVLVVVFVYFWLNQ